MSSRAPSNSAVAVSAETARVIGRPWQKGQSGNPAGRPRKVVTELAEAVRDVSDPRELAEGMWLVAQGKPIAGIKPKMSDVLEARKWLADRGWGRAVDFTPQDGEDPLGIAESRDKLVGRLQAVATSDDQPPESPAPPPAAGPRR